MPEDEIKDLLATTIGDVKTIIKRLGAIEATLTAIQEAYIQHGSRLTVLERHAILNPTPAPGSLE